MYGFATNNAITGVVTQRQEHEQVDVRFRNYSTTPSDKTDGTRPVEVEKLKTHIPGDARVHALPIACHVEFKQRTRRAADGSFYSQDGEGSCRWTKHRANNVLVPNVLVRFRRGPPGNAESWFRLVDVSETRGVLTDATSLIEFTLEQVTLEPEEA